MLTDAIYVVHQWKDFHCYLLRPKRRKECDDVPARKVLEVPKLIMTTCHMVITLFL